MLAQKLQCTLIGKAGAGRIVMVTIGACEGVMLAGIIIQGDQGIGPQSRVHAGLGLGGHEFIIAGDMKHQGPGEAGGLAKPVSNADAVIADTGIAVGMAGGAIGEQAAEAVADGPGLAGAGLKVAGTES